MTDWKQNPRAHEYTSLGYDKPAADPDCKFFPCSLCGHPEAAHDMSEVPQDQVMRQMPESVAPRMFE